MKYLFLMGGSGSGKSTLAKSLEAASPDIYHNVLEITTRLPRTGEVQDIDYDFKTEKEYNLIQDKLFESVVYQFAPDKYGAEYSRLVDSKWNILVVSLEGFLSAMKNMNVNDTAVLINILLDTDLDVQREGRNPLQEQNTNFAVLNQLIYSGKILLNGKSCYYKEIPLSELKTIRSSKKKFIPYFDNLLTNLVKQSLKDQLKGTSDYNELVHLFMVNAGDIGNNLMLLDILEIQCRKFGKNVEQLCNDATKMLQHLRESE